MINKKNYEAYAIDYIEGTLSGSDKNAFERFLAENPPIAAQVKSLQSGMPVLTPDLSVCFEDKAALKRRTPARMLFVRVAAAAAVLLAGVLIFDQLRPPATEQPAAPLTAESAGLPVAAPSAPPAAPLLADNTPTPVQIRPERYEPLTEPQAALRPQPTRQAATTVQSTSGESQSAEPEEIIQTREVIDRRQELVPLSGEVALKTLGDIHRPAEQVVSVTQEYVIERTNELVAVVDPAREGNITSIGMLNVLTRNGFRNFASKLITPLSELSHIEVEENNDERVVKFASIPVRRTIKQENENQ